MKNILEKLLLGFLLLSLFGCGATMHGWTQSDAIGRHMIVNKDSNSLGYRRVQYNSSYYNPLNNFINDKGLPDLIYEDYEGNDHIIYIYYIESNTVYEFKADGKWPDSLYQRKNRPISDYELQTYKILSDSEKLPEGASKEVLEVNKVGLSHFDAKNYEAAIKTFKQAIEIRPDFMPAYYNLGLSYSNLEKYEEAINTYNRAIAIDSSYYKTYFLLGDAYYSLGNFEEAIKSYNKAITRNPDDVMSYCSLGLAYQKAGNYIAAIESFEHALKINSTSDEKRLLNAQIYYQLGITNSYLGNYQIAVDFLEKATRINPDFIQAFIDLGIGYMFLELREDAIRIFKHVIDIQPNNASAHYYLGSIYASLQNKNAAIDEYNKLKNLDAELANKLRNLIYSNLL
ncbi:MAG: tetratricopeptide repeat protein [Nitrospirae bacterium]|nr:tetratricopeptide repeat protein [Nitrospirota bacterium]